MTTPLTKIEHGFAIVRANGRAVDGQFYASQQDAAMVNAFLNGCAVAPARRVTSLRRQTSTTASVRSEIIIGPVAL